MLKSGVNRHKKLDKKCVCMGKEFVVAIIIRRAGELVLVVGMREHLWRQKVR